MKRLLLFGTLWALAAWLPAQEFKRGSTVGDFSLEDTEGNTVRLSALKGEVTVITFIATKCPISNDYNERMKAAFKEYTPRGVKFVFINSNNTEPAAEVAGHAGKSGFEFKVYKDNQNVVADRFGAEFTPEFFVLDKGGVIRYHGALDNSRNLAGVKSQWLRGALDAMLGGNAVAPAETKAFGCTIKRVKKAS